MGDKKFSVQQVSKIRTNEYQNLKKISSSLAEKFQHPLVIKFLKCIIVNKATIYIINVALKINELIKVTVINLD